MGSTAAPVRGESRYRPRAMNRVQLAAGVLLWLCACERPSAPAEPGHPTPVAPAPAPTPITLSIVGTNDLHGHIEALPWLGGYLANLRHARADDGAVVVLDGGDMFQGTIASNLEEGAPVVAAYRALGYDAVAIGNHEFDYGPVGPAATAKTARDDPRGALRARIEEAGFAFLSANITTVDGGPAPLGLPSTLLERAGVRIGVIGATTESTPHTTLAANVADLRFTPLADAIAREATALRGRGAAVVVVAAHAGGKCTAFEDAAALASCERDEEIMHVADALAPGLVDVIVAGHTHQAMAHRVNGIAIIESYANGSAFGRVDLVVDAGRVESVTIHPPQRICRGGEGPAACEPGPYEGGEVAPDPRVAQAIAPAMAAAEALRARELGPRLTDGFVAQRSAECALGNLFTDLMLAARPGHDVAIVNGGGLRAPLPAGPLHYGALYESFPFDNRFATVAMTGAELAEALGIVAGHDGSFFSLGGLRADVRCDGPRLRVTLTRSDGRRVRDDAKLRVLTTDFLATGGDGFFGAAKRRTDAVSLEDGPPIREEMVTVLDAMGNRELAPDAYHRDATPRVRLQRPRPLTCP